MGLSSYLVFVRYAFGFDYIIILFHVWFGVNWFDLCHDSVQILVYIGFCIHFIIWVINPITPGRRDNDQFEGKKPLVRCTWIADHTNLYISNIDVWCHHSDSATSSDWSNAERWMRVMIFWIYNFFNFIILACSMHLNS